jgi:hypothetical protein
MPHVHAFYLAARARIRILGNRIIPSNLKS